MESNHKLVQLVICHFIMVVTRALAKSHPGCHCTPYLGLYNEDGDKNYGKVGPKNKSTSAQSGENKQTMKRKRSGKK